jgi:cytochrome c553
MRRRPRPPSSLHLAPETDRRAGVVLHAARRRPKCATCVRCHGMAEPSRAARPAAALRDQVPSSLPVGK